MAIPKSTAVAKATSNTNHHRSSLPGHQKQKTKNHHHHHQNNNNYHHHHQQQQPIKLIEFKKKVQHPAGRRRDSISFVAAMFVETSYGRGSQRRFSSISSSGYILRDKKSIEKENNFNESKKKKTFSLSRALKKKQTIFTYIYELHAVLLGMTICDATRPKDYNYLSQIVRRIKDLKIN